MEFYPVSPAAAISASCDPGALAGMVAIRPGDLRLPSGGVSALVAGPGAGGSGQRRRGPGVLPSGSGGADGRAPRRGGAGGRLA
jgi:hypothetical protein